jgi:hypothetical protein
MEFTSIHVPGTSCNTMKSTLRNHARRTVPHCAALAMIDGWV